jgi:hypothetical protein
MLMLHDERKLSIDDQYDKGMKPPCRRGIHNTKDNPLHLVPVG